MTTRIVQVTNGVVRRVALVDEPYLRLLVAAAESAAARPPDSLYALAAEAIATSTPLSELVRRRATGEELDYDAIYAGAVRRGGCFRRSITPTNRRAASSPAPA